MKYYKEKLVYMMILLIGMVSCDVFESLEEMEPPYLLTEETTFDTEKKVEAAINGAYTKWRGVGYWAAHFSGLSGYYAYRFTSLFEDMSFTTEDGSIDQCYTYYYKNIQAANFVIDNMMSDQVITGLTDERRKEIEGEARILRAIAHLSLLEMFGQFYDLNSKYGIVLRKEAARTVDLSARSSVQESYDFILSDLNIGIQYAPAFDAHYKVSQITAKAYKAKVLLYMQNYTEAINMASDVIDDANYYLEPNYVDIFLNGYKSSEALFTLSSMSFEDNTYTNPLSFYSNAEKIITLADSEVGATDDGNDDTGEGYDTRYGLIFGSDYVASNVRDNKYPHYNGRDPVQHSTYMFMRLADVYLIQAEANARLAANDPTDANFVTAVDLMNQIRSRSNMYAKAPLTKDELLETLRIERILELHHEWHHEWIDMVRYHFWDSYFDITSEKPAVVSDDQLTLPIPFKAIEANNMLEQNPGW